MRAPGFLKEVGIYSELGRSDFRVIANMLRIWSFARTNSNRRAMRHLARVVDDIARSAQRMEDT